MTRLTSFGCHLAYLAGSVLARASETALGLAITLVGLALVLTVYLMPVGALIALLGVILVMAGSDATEVAWAHLRDDYGARHHVARGQ